MRSAFLFALMVGRPDSLCRCEARCCAGSVQRGKGEGGAGGNVVIRGMGDEGSGRDKREWWVRMKRRRVKRKPQKRKSEWSKGAERKPQRGR